MKMDRVDGFGVRPLTFLPIDPHLPTFQIDMFSPVGNIFQFFVRQLLNLRSQFVIDLK